MDHCDVVVIGAGVVGLAIARELALSGRDVIIVDAADGIGTETSSRNSEVIHAGLYYPSGSLKAALCVRGKQQLYRYCQDHHVPYRRCGKLIVAADDAEAEHLQAIAAQAAANGVEEAELLTQRGLAALEENIQGSSALLSASTGIVDSHALMLSYLQDAESAGAALALRTPVTGGEVVGAGLRLAFGGDSPTELTASLVVNAAGLFAWSVSRRIEGVPQAAIPPMHLCKGSYFNLACRAPASRLVYPVPSKAGLGTHLTLDMAGAARFGPDVEWVDAIDYTVDASRSDGFYSAIRRYWPGLPDGALMPGYAGIRPKVVAPGGPVADFIIQTPEATGAPGYVALYGIESPGLTASLAIAERVAAMA